MTPHHATQRPRKHERGIALAIVLVLIVLLVTAVYAFSRRAVINVNVTRNRVAAAEADAAARGALRMAEAIVFMIRLQEQAGGLGGGDGDNPLSDLAGGDGASRDLWKQFNEFPIEFGDDREVHLTIEELSGRLNLNALVPQSAPSGEGLDDGVSASDEALEYLVLVLRHIIDGIDPANDTNYDERVIAENLIDYMDRDQTSLGGGSEDAYYQQLDPPYSPSDGPFLTFEEIGMVEGVDRVLLEAMRDYVTVHPIGGRNGIDLNRAEPWVLPLVYAGPSGDRELLRERTLRQVLKARKDGKIVCSESATDPLLCVTLADVGIDEGSLFPETVLPAPVSVFRVIATARVGALSRRIEAIYDTRPLKRPQLLSWRRLRGPD
jgi:type II secretory pathway component PulK